MNDRITNIVNAIAEDILTLVHLVMDEQGLANSLLAEETAYKVSMTGNPVIELLFNDYISYIESGRKAGSNLMPPLSAIKEWAERKNIPTDNSTLYAIAQSIRKNGIAPRPILATLEEKIEESFSNNWADNLFEEMVNILAEWIDAPGTTA